MSLVDVMTGLQTWDSYIGNRDLVRTLDRSLSANSRTFRLGAESGNVAAGLGALGNQLSASVGGLANSIEIGFDDVVNGIAHLRADFNVIMGDVVWKLELQNTTLVAILGSLQAPLDTAAKELRVRAEFAYKNGWYEEALDDFLEAAQKNYQDFAIHRSIANIYLFHLINLPKALEYFQKAAKYAAPRDAKQTAEAHYFAGTACIALRDLPAALEAMAAAVAQDPLLLDAHYMHASLAARVGMPRTALESLAAAVAGDSRYAERARIDTVFQPIQETVNGFLDRLLISARERALQDVGDLQQLREQYVVVDDGLHQAMQGFMSRVEDATHSRTYSEWLAVPEAVRAARKAVEDAIAEPWKATVLFTYSERAFTVAFSPKGELLAHGGDRTIHVWDCLERRDLWEVEAHEGYLMDLAFSPDGHMVASCGSDKLVKLWDTSSGRLLRTLKGHTNSIWKVRFGADGTLIASAGQDCTIRIWDQKSDRPVHVLKGPTRFVGLAFHPDGQRLVSADDEGQIAMWDLRAGTIVARLNQSAVCDLAFSHDGTLLAVAAQHKVRVLRAVSGPDVAVLQARAGNDPVSSCATFDPTGSLLATALNYDEVALWNTSTWTPCWVLGSSNAIASPPRLEPGGRGVVKKIEGRGVKYVHSLAFDPRGRFLATASVDGPVRLWAKSIVGREGFERMRGEAGATATNRQ